MAKRDTFNSIIVSSAPRGRKLNAIIYGTPYPGTVMQVKSAVEPVNDLFTVEVYDRGADSDRPKGPLMVLCEDWLQGKTIDDAYADGKVGCLYIPTFGDELLMLVADVSGTTTDTHTIGEMFIIDDGTGKLLTTTGSPEIEPFMCMETLSTGFTADKLVHCWFSGF